MHAEVLSASPWVTRWSHLVSPSQALLDVACGTGRHAKLFAEKGCVVTGVDQSIAALQTLRTHSPSVRTIEADLENASWPLIKSGQMERFDGIVVTNYLHRALMPILIKSLAPHGVLMYETFAMGNEQFGKPSNPAFLLRSGELLEHCKDLHIVAYEEGVLSEPSRVVQRIVAVNRTAKMPVYLL